MRDPAADAAGRFARHHEASVRLHGHAGQPLADHRQLGDDVGAHERILLGADGRSEAHVGAVVGKEERGVRGRRRILGDHRRQRIDIDDDGLGRVDGLRGRLGHDGRDDVADEAHAVTGEDRPVERVRQHGEPLERRKAQVVAGVVDGQDARQALGLVDVDGPHLAVRQRRPHEHHPGRLDRLQVVHVLAGACDQHRVFESYDGIAQDRARFGHSLPLRIEVRRER